MVATYFLPSGNLYKPHLTKRTEERLPVATCFLLLTDKYIHTHIMHTHTHTHRGPGTHATGHTIAEEDTLEQWAQTDTRRLADMCEHAGDR